MTTIMNVDIMHLLALFLWQPSTLSKDIYSKASVLQQIPQQVDPI